MTATRRGSRRVGHAREDLGGEAEAEGWLGGDSVSLRQACWRVLVVFLCTRVALLFATYYGARASPVGGRSALLAGWNGQHYLAIAAQGYPAHPILTKYSLIGFFPGYPLLVRLVSHLSPFTTLGSALFVSLLCGAAFVVVVTRLVAFQWGSEAGERAGVLLAVFPGSFVLSLPYAECLALLLVSSSLLAIADQRPYRAGALAGLATATNPISLALFPALLWRAWRERGLSNWLGAAMAPVGFLAYMGYLWAHTGHAFAWFDVEHDGFLHRLDLFASLHYLRYWPGVGITETASVVVVAFGLIALVRVRAPLEWTIYAAVVIGAVLVDAAVWVNPRFILNAFPLIAGLAVWLRRDQFRCVAIGFAVLLPVVFLMYMTLGSVTAQP